MYFTKYFFLNLTDFSFILVLNIKSNNLKHILEYDQIQKTDLGFQSS